MSINDYSFKYVYVVSMLFKTLSHRFWNTDFELIWLIEFQNNAKFMVSNKCIGFVIDLWNIDLLDTDLDLLVVHG